MKRWLIVLAYWLLCFNLAPAYAWWQSRDSNYNRNIASSGTYTGPGDVISGALMWWGLRCYNSAYTGNVADVYAPADASHTLITCSSGGVLNETLQALSTTCATSCTVKTLYDQTAGNNCTAATCDVVNATIANRPVFTLNCLGSLPCMTFNGTSQVLSSATNATAASQPNTFSAVANSTNTGASQSILSGNGGGAAQLNFRAAANNQAGVYAGTNLNAAATDGSWHALQGVMQGVSSAINVDGSNTTGGANTNGFSGSVAVGAINGTQFMSGKLTEIGAWNSAFSSGQSSSMSTNQHSYWGF